MSTPTERLVAMDVLRGFALLGILLMNIQSFAMPGSAYLNPMSFGDFNGINQWSWIVTHVFADQKFMSLFSMLFGAGVLLFCDKAQQKGKPVTRLHYTRTFWLLMFGLLHGYLFWYGDILYAYGMCGFFIYLMRNKSIKTLLITAAVFMLVSCSYYLFMGASLEYFPAEARTGLMEAWAPDDTFQAKEIAAVTGGFTSGLELRLETTMFMQTYVFLTLIFWRAAAMMLLGMALYKSGFFQLQWQTKSYQKMLSICLPIGLAIVVVGLQANFKHNFSLEFSMFLGSQYNFWGSVFIALGYASLIMLMVQKRQFSALQNRLAAIGKTAFSNYILHTLVFTTVFYGYGLGLFAEVERWQLILMVVTMWAVQLWLSPLWLQRFKFGPLEWAWRSLTYWELQPFRK